MRIKENKRKGFTMGTWRAQKKLKKIKNKKVEGGGGGGGIVGFKSFSTWLIKQILYYGPRLMYSLGWMKAMQCT